MPVDGGIGPRSKEALCCALFSDTFDLLGRLRREREAYELRVAGRRENFWRGLSNRWNNAFNYGMQIYLNGL